MKQGNVAMKLMLAAMLPCAVAMGFTVDLSKAQIECAKNGVESCRTAAAELEKHLALIAPGRTGDGEIAFVVGKAPPGTPAPGQFESYARASGGKVYFWGDDAKHEMDTAKGTLFAVYEFLDKALGVKWVFPGDDGIVFSKRATLNVKDGAEWSYRPSFDLLRIRITSPEKYCDTARSDVALMPKEMTPTREEIEMDYTNQVQWLDRMRTVPTNRFVYCHAFCSWQKRFLKQHPDWFGLDPERGREDCGRRGLPDEIAERAKFCLSNPEVTDAIVAEWRDNLGAKRYFNICPNDGTPGFCHCENCCKLDTRREGEAFLDHLTDRYLWFWNGICDKAVKIRPDVRCVAYIYGYYRHKPRRERVKYPDNMVFGVVPGFLDDYAALYRDWQEVGMKHFFLRPNFTCYSAVFPRGLEKWLYTNFKVSREYGMIGVDYDGSPRPVMDFEYYVIASLASRPERNFEDISREFYSQYGAAADVARAYFEKVRERANRTGATMKTRVMETDRHMLDDSELAKYAFLGCTVADLEADCAVLAQGEAMALDPAAGKRFRRLVLRAENALLTLKFLVTSRGRNNAAFMEAAKALYDFRLKNRYALGNEGFHWYSVRNCENPAWKRYAKSSAAPKGKGHLEDAAATVVPAVKCAGMPEILLIGDSIRIGYCKSVATALEGKAVVKWPAANCQNSQNILISLPRWRGLVASPKVVQFNCGHWDVSRWDGDDDALTTVEEYARNVRKIIRRIRRYWPEARIVFATTTPMNPSGRQGRNMRTTESIRRYNEAAVAVAKSEGVAVNDLFAVTEKWPASDYEDYCHFNTTAADRLGRLVAERLALEAGL